MKRATAYANANIALVKYWGKANETLNIPAVSSLSMTLSDLGTTVTVSPSELLAHTSLIDGHTLSGKPLIKLSAYLEQMRKRFFFEGFLRVTSKSTIPYASGLASSASFYAALATAINEYLGLGLDKKALSTLARMGSGSAARSIFSGFSGLFGGAYLSHEEAYASPLEAHQSLDVAMVLAIVSTDEKSISSREAMTITQKTSPFYGSFVDAHDDDFAMGREALSAGKFEELGSIMEHSTLKMFATMWTARPAILYWQKETLAIINSIYELRKKHGPIAFFTMDAGPNVKVLCQSKSLPLVVSTIASLQATEEIRCSTPGPGAEILREHLA